MNKWLRLDIGDGWQMVLPEEDIAPHTTATQDEIARVKESGSGELEVAGMVCPCAPKVDATNQIIVHNSFEDAARIEEAMSNPKTSSTPEGEGSEGV